MGLTASLDIGSEKMVMAVAENNHGFWSMKGIKMVASQGVNEGGITDKSKVRSYIHHLLKELDGDREIERINIGVSGKNLHISDCKGSVVIQKRVVKENDIARAEMKCAESVILRNDEIIDMIPFAYSVDRGNYVSDALGKTGRNLDVRFRVYKVDSDYLSSLRDIFEDCGIREVNFFPLVRGYMEALQTEKINKRFALVDLGATHMDVMIFRNGVPEYETTLPLGTSTIDNDIMVAFRLDSIQQAKNLKHTQGVAFRSICKNEKLQIPEAKIQIEKKDLAKVIQCRLEELLEGVVYQLQQWRFSEPDKEILLTGGGSRITGTDILLNKLSGQKVSKAKASGIEVSNKEFLEVPACVAAIGLLFCEHAEPEEKKSGIGGWISTIFGGN
ncbi:MAG: cell division protein FtsA [Odoribacter sp.]|nr:cell division protein FtsA [Odoribacter sp.]